MKGYRFVLALALLLGVFASSWLIVAGNPFERFFNEAEPDLPSGVKIEKEEYFRLRNEYLDMVRGFDTAKQDSRTKAIDQMERS